MFSITYYNVDQVNDPCAVYSILSQHKRSWNQDDWKPLKVRRTAYHVCVINRQKDTRRCLTTTTSESTTLWDGSYRHEQLCAVSLTYIQLSHQKKRRTVFPFILKKIWDIHF